MWTPVWRWRIADECGRLAGRFGKEVHFCNVTWVRWYYTRKLVSSTFKLTRFDASFFKFVCITYLFTEQRIFERSGGGHIVYKHRHHQ